MQQLVNETSSQMDGVQDVDANIGIANKIAAGGNADSDNCVPSESIALDSLSFRKNAVGDETMTETEPPDPFDPANLRLNPENSGVLVKKVITSIPCRKPDKQEFVRCRPGNWYLDTLILEDKANRDYYVVDSSLQDHLAQEGFRARLSLATTRSGDLFLWLQKLPSADGRTCRWNDSMQEAATLSESKWIRVASNMETSCYDVFEASGTIPEPQWTDLAFSQILRLCFKDRFINSLDHPLLRRLRGEI